MALNRVGSSGIVRRHLFRNVSRIATTYNRSNQFVVTGSPALLSYLEARRRLIHLHNRLRHQQYGYRQRGSTHHQAVPQQQQVCPTTASGCNQQLRHHYDHGHGPAAAGCKNFHQGAAGGTSSISRFLRTATTCIPQTRPCNHVVSRKYKVASASTAVASGSGCRWKSTASASDATALNGAPPPPVLSTEERQDGPEPKRDPLDLSFQDAEAAYKSKTTFEILRAILVFQLCSNQYLVENNMQLMKWGRNALGRPLFRLLMKASFYGHFVAGEDQQGIRPTIDRMRQFGVKAILDYSVEEDISHQMAERLELASLTPPNSSSTTTATASSSSSSSQQQQPTGDPDASLEQYHVQKSFADRRRDVVAARTYFYLNEAQCEKNMEIFLNCIDAVSGTTNSTGFAAIKMTALGRPQLLMQLSKVIARTKRYFSEVTGLHDAMILRDIKPSYFEKRFNEAHISTDKPEVKKWLAQMTYDQKGLIHLFSWSGLIDSNILLSDLFRVVNLQTGKMEPIISALTEEEEEMFRNMMRRLRKIADRATEKDVRVMIDAEQTYFQPAISRITVELMRKYNREKSVIFNTYQCYLKSAFHNVVLDLEQAERQNFYFGAKLVRGAYMEQERQRAQSVGYEDPILPTYEATNEMYEKTLSECMARIKRRGGRKIAVMVASHNEDTVRFTINKMKELGLGPRDRVACFGQLLGMCDQVTFPLGQAGYSVYKYVPYGPVDEVLPYLSRRARENSGMLTKVKKEKQLLWKELKRRISKGQIFYRPKGDYEPV